MSVERSALNVERSAPRGAVFLSYAREDANAARRIAEALRSRGVEVWFDENELRGGEAWDQKIRRQINECSLFLPVISEHTQARSKGYFRLEWKLAVEQTHLLLEGVPFLAPVVIDDTPESRAAVPSEFLRVQWIRLPGALPTPQFVEQVKRLLEAPAPPAPIRKEAARGSQTVALGPAGHVAHATTRKAIIPGWAWAVLTIVVVAVVVFFATRTPTANPEPAKGGQAQKPMDLAPAKSTRIAVLPLDNISPDANDAYLAVGMTEELTSSLSKISGLEVIARTSSEQAKKAGKNLSQIGAELRVGTLLEGSVRKAGEQLRISVQLIDVATQRNLWSQDYNKELKDVFKVQTDVAERVAEALKVTLLGSEVRRLKKEPTANMEAYGLYVLGRFFWNKRTGADLNKAIDYFNQALARDPNYAEVHAGLALCYALLSEYTGGPSKESKPKAEAAANKALKLDPTLGEPHTVLAYAKRYLHDWTGEETEYQAALRLDPNSATTHQWLSEHFAYLRRYDDALAEIQRAEELDPFSSIIRLSEAWALWGKGRIDQAIQVCRKALELNPDFSQLHGMLGLLLSEKHLFPEAVAEARKAKTLDPANNYLPGVALARSGDKTGTAQVLNELEDRRRKGFEVRMLMAGIYVELGETDKALDLVEQTLAAGEFIGWIAYPNWNELRPNPRFQALLKKIGLEK